MSDPPLVPGPIYGLRTWGVIGSPGAERLTGPHRSAPWPTGGALLDAECSAEPPHDPPGADCECGLHAWHPTRTTARRVCGMRGRVPGILEATGAIEVHVDGFRAARGRPFALVLLPEGNARRLERLAATYDVELLRLAGPEELLELCRARGLGLAAGAVTELIGAENIAARRRERRRRGALTAIGATLLALVVAAIIVAAHPHTQHGKVLNGRTGEIRVP